MLSAQSLLFGGIPAMLVVSALVAHADLIQIQVLARHGLRKVFDRDEIEVWDDGGELSGHGYAMMATMGATFRERYTRNLTGSVWNSSSGIMARSTDSPASMMSATAFLLGLARPGSGPVDELTGKPALPITMQPIAVHTVPMPLDIPLRAYDKCPNFLDRLDTVMNSTDISAWNHKNRDALDKLGRHTDSKVTAATYLDAFEIVAVEHAFGNTTDITDTEYAQYENMAAFVAAKMFTEGADVNHMLAGRLLANMAQHIGAAVNAANVTVPFVYLSGQYPSIMAAYSALGVYAGNSRGSIPAQLPSPGAALVVELHQDSEGSFNVRILVHDPSRGRHFQEVVPAQCEGASLCPLDKFMPVLVAGAIDPGDWCALCNNTVTPPCNAAKPVEIPVPVPGPCPPPSPSEAQSGTGVLAGGGSGRSTTMAILTGIGIGLLLSAVLFALVRFAKSRAFNDRLLPRLHDAWNRRGTRTPNHVELQA